MLEFLIGFIAISAFIMLIILIAHIGKCKLLDAAFLVIFIPILLLGVVGTCVSMGEAILSIFK